MSLIKRDFPMLGHLSDFFEDDWFPMKKANGGWSPAVNVADHEDHYEIEIAAPGLKKEDFDVSVENGVLTISGKTEKEEEEKKKNYTRKEFSSRSFIKTFNLPDHVKQEELQARYDEGVLRLTLKKEARKTPPKRMVEIV